MRRYRRKIKSNWWFVALMCVTAAALVAAFLLIDARVRPMIENSAVVQAQSYAAVSAGERIPEILSRTQSTYESLVNIVRDEAGNIISIETDAMQLNLLKSQINSAVSASLAGLGRKELGIPVGSLTGLALLNGRGPLLNIIVNITGSAQTLIISTFDCAGINQTRHRLYLKTVVTMLIVFQDSAKTAAYTYEMLAAETVIMGTVPGVYAGITQK